MNFQMKPSEGNPRYSSGTHFVIPVKLSLFLLIFNFPLILSYMEKQVKELNWSNLGFFQIWASPIQALELTDVVTENNRLTETQKLEMWETLLCSGWIICSHFAQQSNKLSFFYLYLRWNYLSTQEFQEKNLWQFWEAYLCNIMVQIWGNKAKSERIYEPLSDSTWNLSLNTCQ